MEGRFANRPSKSGVTCRGGFKTRPYALQTFLKMEPRKEE